MCAPDPNECNPFTKKCRLAWFWPWLNDDCATDLHLMLHDPLSYPINIHSRSITSGGDRMCADGQFARQFHLQSTFTQIKCSMSHPE